MDGFFRRIEERRPEAESLAKKRSVTNSLHSHTRRFRTSRGEDFILRSATTPPLHPTSKGGGVRIQLVRVIQIRENQEVSKLESG